MLDCRQATELAQLALDQPLTTWARVKLGLHRLLCAPCRIYKHQILQLRRLSRQLRDTGGQARGLDDAARARIRAGLRDAGRP